MKRKLLKAKIHRATVTEANLHYEGSISLDPALIRAAGLMEFEAVDIYNCTNGERFSTYVILGGPGEVCLNGAAARLVQPGDSVIIANYAEYGEGELTDYRPKLVFVDSENGVCSINAPAPFCGEDSGVGYSDGEG